MKSLKILIFKQSEDEAGSYLRHLANGGYRVEFEIVRNPADMKSAFNKGGWDLVLSDYAMPNLTTLDAISVLKESGLDIPLVIIAGDIAEDLSVEAVSVGIQDYFMKYNPAPLDSIIDRELENSANRRRLKQSEAARRLGEKSLAQAQRLAHIGSWIFDVQNNTVFWSDELYRIHGLPKGLIENNPELILSLVHPEDRSTVVSARDAAFSKGVRYDLETRIIRPDGEERVTHSLGEVTFDEAGKPLYITGTVQDITERKRMEEEKEQLIAQIEYQNNRLNDLIASMPGAVWEFKGAPGSADFKMNFVSEYIEKLIGYTANEWLTSPDIWLAVMHPDDQEGAVRTAVENFEKRQDYTHEFRWIAKDGRVVWVEAHVVIIYDKDGNPDGLRGINLDVTHRKQIEAERARLTAELDFERARLQHIFDHAPAFIVSMRGPEFVFEMANPSFYELVGRRELIGVPARKAMPELDSKIFFENLEEVYKTGKPFVGSEIPAELQPPGSDKKQLRYVNFTYLPQRGADGSISGIISYGVDVTEQVLSRFKIEESEERYRFLYESNPLPMWVVDSDTLSILSVNEAAIKHYGYSQEEFLTLTLKDIRPQEDVPAFLDYLKGDSDEISRGMIFRHQKKDGTIIYVERTSRKFKFNGKNAMLVLANDITERRRAERKIKESEERYRIVAETASDVIVTINEHNEILFVNSAAEKVLGYKPRELIGKSIEVIIPSRFRERHNAGVRRYMETCQRHLNWDSIEIFALHRDGREIQVEISFGEYDENNKRLFTAIIRDITERKQTEEALRLAEDKYRSLVESSPVIVYLTEPEPPNSTTYISPNVSRFGYSAEEWCATPDMWTSLLHLEDRERALREFESALMHNAETDQEYRIVARDGKIYWIHDKGRFVFDENGKKIGWQGVLVDITRTKDLEEQLRQSQKLESVGLLAGGIAHDFNNMLTAINGYSELALRKVKADDPIRSNIEEIKKAGERSAALTQQLLAFSRRQMLRPVVLDLNEVISDTIKMLKRLIGENVQLTTTLNPKVGRIKVDPGQFSQIVMNLAINARDAMLGGGKLTIETANVFLDAEYTSHHVGVLPGAYVMLAISDTGTGMSSDTKKHIFDPFFTTKEIGQGTGLGLATVYGIVKQSGGNIEVYSEEGFGTTFKIYLPRVADQVSPERIMCDAEEMPKGTETVLLVEDEEMVRHLSQQILEECGYRVIVARDGLEALKICERENYKFDMLMTDVVMPYLGGRELSETLQTKLPGLPVLFTSGYTDDAVVRHGVIETNSNFLQKPFTPESLARKIREILDNRK